MHVIDVITARKFFTARAPLPTMVYVGGSTDASGAASETGVPAGDVIAAFNRWVRGVFLSGVVFAPCELRFASRLSDSRTIRLDEILEFRPGFEIAEIVLRGGERVRLDGELNPFLRLCVECLRETGTGTLMNRTTRMRGPK